MESITIDILNPKAKKLLEDLEDLNLIKVKHLDADWKAYLQEMRKNADSAPSMEEIVQEVKKVRAERYDSKN